MRKLNFNPNVINSDANYPNGRIRNNTSSGNGTPVNESVYGDIHVNKDKMMDLYGIAPNDLPDNEANGYQIIEAHRALATKNDFVLPLTLNTGVLSVPIKIGFMLENEQVICKAGFNMSTETQIKGSDNVTLSFTSNGDFKTNEYVRLIKKASSIELVILCDYVPNLETRLSDIETAQTTINQKLAVFTVNGVMFIWRKAGAIPTGFQEVTDFAGKTIFGLDVSQTEFALINTYGGAKTKTITSANLPSNVKIPTYVSSGLSPDAGALNCNFDLNTPADLGSGTAMDVLNPYGVVRFIEWATV